MKISIDTSNDSKDEIKMAIRLLSQIVNVEKSEVIQDTNTEPGIFNMFNSEESVVPKNEEKKLDEPVDIIAY